MQLVLLSSASSCGFLVFSWCCLNKCLQFFYYFDLEVEEMNQQGLFAFS